MILGYPRGSHIVTSVFKRGRGGRRDRGDSDAVAGFDDGGRGHKARDAGGL